MEKQLLSNVDPTHLQQFIHTKWDEIWGGDAPDLKTELAPGRLVLTLTAWGIVAEVFDTTYGQLDNRTTKLPQSSSARVLGQVLTSLADLLDAISTFIPRKDVP